MACTSCKAGEAVCVACTLWKESWRLYAWHVPREKLGMWPGVWTTVLSYVSRTEMKRELWPPGSQLFAETDRVKRTDSSASLPIQHGGYGGKEASHEDEDCSWDGKGGTVFSNTHKPCQAVQGLGTLSQDDARPTAGPLPPALGLSPTWASSSCFLADFSSSLSSFSRRADFLASSRF